jgi:glycosyltransferase involved in cell wall biosynthesis
LSLKKQFGVERCIFSLADDFHPATNALQLFRSLGKINLPSIVIGKYSGTRYAETCRQIAQENPNIRVIDDEEGKNKLLFSALAACDVFVDPSASGFWAPLTVNAAVLGKKVVVTKSSGLQEYFGGGVEFAEPTSWELIHHGIVTVLNNTTNASLRSFLKEECSMSRVLAGLHSTYRSAIGL